MGARQARSLQSALWGMTFYQSLHTCALKLHAVIGFGHGQQHVNLLGGARCTTRHMQTMWNECVFKLEHFFAQAHHLFVQIGAHGGCIPNGFCSDQIKFHRLGLNDLCQRNPLVVATFQ